MDEAKKNDLKNDVKEKLRITWNQEKTEKEIETLVDDAEKYLNHLLGAEIDYSAPGIERLLFLNFCMYAWNNCQEDFENAYLKDIIRCRAKYEVIYHERENSETE